MEMNGVLGFGRYGSRIRQNAGFDKKCSRIRQNAGFDAGPAKPPYSGEYGYGNGEYGYDNGAA
jgi:hypothetical protein